MLQEVREAAVSLVERACKRFPCLAPKVLPPLLAALAKLPAGTQVSWLEGWPGLLTTQPCYVTGCLHSGPPTPLAPMLQGTEWGASLEQLLPALQSALQGAGAAAAASTEPESEQEQAQAIGACRVLEGRGVWRYINRDWTASWALMLALLASGVAGGWGGLRRAAYAHTTLAPWGTH